jgi:hypothetical protein
MKMGSSASEGATARMSTQAWPCSYKARITSAFPCALHFLTSPHPSATTVLIVTAAHGTRRRVLSQPMPTSPQLFVLPHSLRLLDLNEFALTLPPLSPLTLFLCNAMYHNTESRNSVVFSSPQQSESSPTTHSLSHQYPSQQ